MLSHCTENPIYVFPEKKLRGLSPTQIPTFVCPWAIYLFPGSVHIFGYSKIDRPILEREHYYSVLEIMGLHSFIPGGIHKWEPDMYIEFSPAFHMQCTMKWFGKKFEFNNSRDPVPSLHNRWRMTSYSTRSSWRTTGRRRRSRWRWPCPCSTGTIPRYSRIRRPHRRRRRTAFPTPRWTIANKAANPRVYHLQRKGMRVRTTIFSGLPGTHGCFK